MSGFKYPRGSEWRKWDLHVHTKSDSSYTFSSDHTISIREQNDDEYPKVFIEHIYSIDNMGAIAITDHNKADWIDKIIEANEYFSKQNNLKEENVITIFPGVEIESSDGIHLLVIFNPETQSDVVNRNFRRATWRETIEHFLTAIRITSTNNSSKTTEEIMEEAEKWDAICIFAHVIGNRKGFFGISSGNTKKRIYSHRLTQIFQIPINGILDIGKKNIIEGRNTQYCDDKGIPKSICCITSSDAKSLADIGRNNLWIKADPTFEGLKQIIYEPDERVYIGEEPPRKIERNKVIRSITISNSNNWFEDKPILLNEGLVSIIGGKGTGKTAILDLIAYATESYKCYEKDGNKSKSFLKKAFKELKGAKIKVEWEDGNSDEKEIKDKLEEFVKEGKVRYLPQDYVDQLCSEIGKNELERQIEDVIFQKIPLELKATYTDFKSYKDAQLKVINNNKKRVAQQIRDINSQIYQHKLLIKSKPTKKEDIKKIGEEIKRFEREIERISEAVKDSEEQKEILTKLQALTEKKSNLEKTISRLKTKLLKIEEIKSEVAIFLENLREFLDELKKDLEDIGVKKEVIEKVRVVLYPEDLEQVLDERNKIIETKIKKRQTKLNDILKDIHKENGKINLEKSKQDKIKEINKSLSELRKKKDSLNADIKKIEDAEKELPQLLENRESLFLNYFELIFEEKKRLEEIYSPLENILKSSGEENEKLFDFAVKFNFDVDSMADEGHELIDLRAEGEFRQSRPEKLKEKLEELKFSLNLDNKEMSEADKESIRKFLKRVEELFTKEGKSLTSQLKEKRYTEQDFYSWLYSTRYYDISYSIKFNGIELNNLSPGLKGVALLILFLELDKEDKRPFLIDQPEENLDNRSIYHTLVRYFRDAKKRRQVIIVTHNPNLVVNTDSEQVIVADFDRSLERQNSRIFYVSGSLENTSKDDSAEILLEKQGIREHVCLILEGGKDAFEKREKKYGFRTT
ncbi:MAG: hypothetical protein H0Z29_04605, partial [Candidatus Marinimicrobia bacterium]|nr:hypothetical protein [Candidatus Neomarinimicrobiota bacterium]